MDSHQIASLGCKLLGIYALLESIQLFGHIFQMYAFARNDPVFGVFTVLTTTIPFIVMLAFGAVLILNSDGIAYKIKCLKNSGQQPQAVSFKELQTIAFSIVGLVLLVLSIPKMMQIGWNIYAVKSAGDERNVAAILSNTWSFALSTGVQFLIGFILFIGAELFSTLWHKSIKRLKYERNIT